MNEIGIADADINAVVEGIKRLGSDVQGFGTVDPAWARPPAVLVIDCVLSLNRKYDGFVVPRLDAFVNENPKVRKVRDLAKLIASYPTPHAFVQQELNYNYEDRANTLHSVVEFVCKIVEEMPNVPEEDVLKQWAIQAKPEDYQTLNIKGFGIAGFQYLRMLFGADTTKPDVHIIRFVSKILDRNVSAIEALHLLETSSERLGLSVRDVDTYIWEISARLQQDASNTNTNEKTEAAYNEFWEPILRGELGKLFAGKPKSHHNHGWMGKTIGNIELWLRLTNRKCYIRLYFRGTNPLEQRDELMALFQKPDYNFKYKDTPRITTVIFPVLDKGKNNRVDWNEIRKKLVEMGTDIYNKINESGL